MKVLQVISTPPFVWETGGCTRVAFELSKALVNNGNDVTILTTDMKNRFERNVGYKNPEISNGVKIYRFKNISNRLAWDRYIYTDIGICNYLHKNIKNFDIVHLHDFRSVQTIATAYFCHKHKIPFVIQPHGAPLATNHLLKCILDKTFTRYALDKSSFIISLTNDERNRLIESGIQQNKIKMLPNGIEQTPSRSNATTSFKRFFNIPDDIKIILFLGRIHPIKGIDLLLKAYHQSINKLERCKLVIVGPDYGDLRRIERMVSELGLNDDVRIIGHLDGHMKDMAYQEASLYVLPSKFETYPMTVLESLVNGTPVIVTDRCGIADMIKDRFGLVCEYDENKLAYAIQFLLNNSDLSMKFGIDGKNYVSNELNWEKISTKAIGIYMDAICNNKIK